MIIFILLFLFIQQLAPLNMDAVMIPWYENRASPAIMFIKVGMNKEDTVGMLAHEGCHIRQFAEGRYSPDKVRELEYECEIVEYFAYRNIDYQPGMDRILHK